MTKRETAHIFDLVLKRLLELSDMALVVFINGLFGSNHSLESRVERPKTESVSKKLRRLMSDTIIIVNGIYAYHIEGEIDGDDENIVIRVFEYGFAEALRTKESSANGKTISLRFPDARIIYWESTGHTPDEVTLSLSFPGNGHYDYKVKTLKFLEHGIKELEEQHLAILLPFYVLKLRQRTVSARTSKRRAELAEEMKSILDELVTAIERCGRVGLMTEADKRAVLEYTERLYRELFAQYSEFKEADTILQDRILTYSEEARLEGINEGIKEGVKEGIKKGVGEGKRAMAKELLANGVQADIIAKSAGLPLETVKALIN